MGDKLPLKYGGTFLVGSKPTGHQRLLVFGWEERYGAKMGGKLYRRIAIVTKRRWGWVIMMCYGHENGAE